MPYSPCSSVKLDFDMWRIKKAVGGVDSGMTLGISPDMYFDL